MNKPKRRKKKKKRYDFLNKEYIVESDDTEEMDWDGPDYESFGVDDCDYEPEEPE